jgi:hypothetical protein
MVEARVSFQSKMIQRRRRSKEEEDQKRDCDFYV